MPDTPSTKKKHHYAKALGRKGGKKRAANLSPEERSESAKKAAIARWAKTKQGSPPEKERQ